MGRRRATRKYARQPIPDEFRQAAADMAGRYSPSLVRRILKLDPWRVNKLTTKKPYAYGNRAWCKKSKKASLLSPPSDVPRRIGAVADEERSRSKFD